MEIRKNALTPELFLELYRSVGWEPPCREQAEAALDHTLADFVAYERDRPVGMARVIGDQGMSFYVKDFAVVPEDRRDGFPGSFDDLCVQIDERPSETFCEP